MKRSIVLATLFLAACGSTSAPVSTTPQPSEEAPSATVTFMPATLTLAVGEEKSVVVEMDTKGRSSMTYEATIAFDSKVIDIVDADAEKAGVQVESTAYASLASNKVENGRIILMGYTTDMNAAVNGKKTLATIRVKGKAAGTTGLDIRFDPGSTTDEIDIMDRDAVTDLTGSVGKAAITVQ